MLATAASAEPMAKVMVMVRFVLMPISPAASLSSETARIALPSFVLLINRVSAIMMIAVTPRVTRVMPSIVTCPSLMAGSFRIVGNAFCSEPKISSATFCSR